MDLQHTQGGCATLRALRQLSVQRLLLALQFAHQRDCGRSVFRSLRERLAERWGEQAAVEDAVQGEWRPVHQEPPEELNGCQLQHLLAVVVPVVHPARSDGVGVDRVQVVAGPWRWELSTGKRYRPVGPNWKRIRTPAPKVERLQTALRGAWDHSGPCRVTVPVRHVRRSHQESSVVGTNRPAVGTRSARVPALERPPWMIRAVACLPGSHPSCAPFSEASQAVQESGPSRTSSPSLRRPL